MCFLIFYKCLTTNLPTSHWLVRQEVPAQNDVFGGDEPDVFAGEISFGKFSFWENCAKLQVFRCLSIISSNIKLIRMRKHLFQSWNMFDVGRFFFAVILCCTKHRSLISLILILGQIKIEELPWPLRLFSPKYNNVKPNNYFFFSICKNPSEEEDPFQFETTSLFRLYQPPPHRYMALSNQQEPRSHPHPIHQEVMFQQPLQWSPLRATTLMVPTHPGGDRVHPPVYSNVKSCEGNVKEKQDTRMAWNIIWVRDAHFV